MTMKTILAILGASLPLLAGPVKVDLLKIGSKEYAHASISSDGRFIAKITHDDGVTRIPVSQLPEEIRGKVSPPISAPTKPQVRIITMGSEPVDSSLFLNVLSHIQEKESAHWRVNVVNVVQSIGDGLVLATLDESLDMVMVYADASNLADGDKFSANLQDTGRVQEYKTVLGAMKKVRVYTSKRATTRALMIEVLKAGGTYDITMGETAVICLECGGRPVPCDVCLNKGVIMVPQPVMVTW